MRNAHLSAQIPLFFLKITLTISTVFLSTTNSSLADDNTTLEYDHAEDSDATESARDLELKSLMTITITSDPRNPSLLEHSLPAGVLTKDDLTLKAQTSLGETLNNEPGMRSTYFGPASSRPVIRGNAGERVRILRNGVGSQDISNTSEDHQISINPLSAESVEILRGPETLLYGSSAIGGIVNVIDGSIPSKEIGEDLKGEFNLRTETVNNEAMGALKLEGQIGKINWHLSGLSQDTKNIDIPGYAESSRLREQESEHGEEHDQVRGTLLDSASRTRTGTLGTSYVWEKGYIGLAFTGYGSNYGVPGHDHSGHGTTGQDHSGHGHDSHSNDSHGDDHGSEEEGVRIDLEQYRLDMRGEFRDVSNSIEKIRFASAASDYKHREIEDGRVGSRFSNKAFESRVELMHAPIQTVSGTLGTQFEYSEFESSGLEAFVPNSRRFAPGIFAFEELPLIDETLKAQFGGRVEVVNIEPEFSLRERTFAPLSLSTGLSWDLNSDNAYIAGLSVAYTERAPAATELYANGVHVARRIAEIGNDSLSVENSLGVDLTFRKNTGLVTGGLALFAQEYDNYINLESTGNRFSGSPQFSYTETRARFLGFEAESTFHLHELLKLHSNQVDFSAQVDYVNARDTKRGNDLPRIPPFRTILRGSYGYGDLFTTGIEGVFVAAQRNIADGELPTDAYQMLNLTYDMRIPYLENDNLMLYARGQNLTNEEARVHSSFLKDLAPLPGRSFLAGIRGTF